MAEYKNFLVVTKKKKIIQKYTNNYILCSYVNYPHQYNFSIAYLR